MVSSGVLLTGSSSGNSSVGLGALECIASSCAGEWERLLLIVGVVVDVGVSVKGDSEFGSRVADLFLSSIGICEVLDVCCINYCDREHFVSLYNMDGNCISLFFVILFWFLKGVTHTLLVCDNEPTYVGWSATSGFTSLP
jgi:hypothetical protein